MLGYLSPTPLSPESALGGDLMRSFAALARLHSDGWGAAWTTATGTAVTARVRLPGADPVFADLDAPTRSGILYLRLASRGSAVAAENLQPFAEEDLAFAHNGLLTPRDTGLAALTAAARSSLRGTTDSEVYLALIRAAARSGATPPRPCRVARHGRAPRAGAVPHGVPQRAPPRGRDLVVIHAPGEAPTPSAAFASHGVAEAELPPGHDESYNLLATTVLDTGARIVATTGIDQSGWDPLPRDTVTVITAEGAFVAVSL